VRRARPDGLIVSRRLLYALMNHAIAYEAPMIPCPRCKAKVSTKALRSHLLFHAEAEARALLAKAKRERAGKK